MSEPFNATQTTTTLRCSVCACDTPHFVTDARENGRACCVRTCLRCGEEVIEVNGQTLRAKKGARP